MTIKSFKSFCFILLLATLISCQQAPKKQPEYEAGLEKAWTHLQQSTLNNLQEKNYGEAKKHIKQMMAFAGDEFQRWEYIRMALVSMPVDLANPLIEQALKKSVVANDAEQLYGFSKVLTQMKQTDQAMKLINKAIKIDNKEAYIYWRARLYLLLENDQLSEKDYQWLIKQQPNNVDYITQYVTLLTYLKRNDEAIELLEKNEDEPALLLREVVLLLQDDREDDALFKFKQLIDLIAGKDLSPTLNLEIAELAFWLEDYTNSMQLLQKIKSGDELNKAKILMGRVLIEEKNYDRASIVFHQVQNGPETYAIPAYLYEIELYRIQEKYAEAIKVATTGLKMFAKNADLLYSRAMLFEQIDDIDALEKDLMGILKTNPDNADALNALGYTWVERDMNLEQAYDYIMQAYELKPNNKAVLDSVGWVYYKKGDLSKAEKYLRLAVEDNQQDLESYQHLITVLNELGKKEEVDIIKEKIKSLFPEASPIE